MTSVHLRAYAQQIRNKLRADASTLETGLAPDFRRLVADLLATLPAVAPLTVSPEYNSPGVGRPDIALIRHGQPARAFIELKASAKSADPERWRDADDKRQYGRLKELAHWSTSNFTDFHLLGRAARLGSAAIVPNAALNRETPDATANRLIDAHDAQPFLDLLATLARAEAPAARNAQQLAELMAHSARLVKSAVQERIGELNSGPNAHHPLLRLSSRHRRPRACNVGDAMRRSFIAAAKARVRRHRPA